MAVTARIHTSVVATETLVQAIGHTARDPLSDISTRELTSGTGGSQVDVIWHDQRTLGSSASEDLDLAGSLTSALGASVFARVTVLLVRAAATNTVDLQVSRPANGAPFFAAEGDGLALPPGGQLLLSMGASSSAVAITAGTGDLLRVTAGAAASTYDVVVIGTSA